MAVAFPSSLRPMVQASKSRSQEAVYSVAAPRRARGDIGPAGTDKPVVWECSFVYSDAEAQVFLDWFFNDLGGGALLASMPIRTEFGLITHVCRFLDDSLLATRQSGETWEYTAKVITREQIVPAEAVTAWAGAFDGPVPAPPIVAGSPYSIDLTGYWTGGEGPFTWSVAQGMLPSGITLNPDTGIVSGICPHNATLADVVFRRTDVFCVARDGGTAPGDPYFASVSLLLKMEGAEGSKTLVDRSSYAVNGTLPTISGRTVEIRQGLGPHGAGVAYSTADAPLVRWTGTRFNKPSGKGFCIEGWFKVTAPTNSTASPPLVRWRNQTTSLNSAVIAKYSDLAKMLSRYSSEADDTIATYTPGASGWNYYCLTVTPAGRARTWINLVLMHDSGANVVGVSPANPGQIDFLGYDTAGNTYNTNFQHGEFRVTQEERYPSGPTELPGPFPVF